jgi:hypothetical protein
MLFVKLEDATNTVELLIFPRLLKETPDLWVEGRAIITDSKLSEKDQEVKVLVNRAFLLNPLEAGKSVDDFKKLLLEGGPVKKSYRPGGWNGRESGYNRIEPERKTTPAPAAVKPAGNPLRIIFLHDLAADNLMELRKIFSLYPGDSEVYFRLTEEGKAKIIKTAFRVDNNENLRIELKSKFLELIKIAE